MPTPVAVAILGFAFAIAGCAGRIPVTPSASSLGPVPTGPTGPIVAASGASSLPTWTAVPSAGPELPAGFPVPVGAVPIDGPEEEDLLARWSVEISGASAYAFYAEALPAAGFAVVELIPGGTAAVIRFRGPLGAAWMLVLRGVDPLLIELRRDPGSAIGGDGGA